MQTSKERGELSEVHYRTSPVTPRSSNASKMITGSKPSPTKIISERSPRITQRWSPKIPVLEKTRSIKQSDLESQIAQLQDELKKAKDELSSSESSKQQLQQELEEAKKQITVMSTKLEKAQSHLVEFSKNGDACFQGLCKISLEHDEGKQSGLEVLQKQNLAESNVWGLTMNEIQKLKQHFNVVTKSEAAQLEDSDMAQHELVPSKAAAPVLSAVENHKEWIREGKVEEETNFVVLLTCKQLEMTKRLIENLCPEGTNFQGSLNTSIPKLVESKFEVDVADEIAKEHLGHWVLHNAAKVNLVMDVGSTALHSELELLRAAFDAAEARHPEEHIQTSLQIRSAFETGDFVNVNSAMRKSDLQKTSADFRELESRLLDMERELHVISEMNKELKEEMEKEKASQVDSELKLIRANTGLAELKAILLDKETELQCILEENEQLKSQLGIEGTEQQKNYAEAIADADRARAAEQEVSRRLAFLNAEVEKNSNMATKVMDQLKTAQAVISDMEAELRRLRSQSDQWRKAAEAAAAMLGPSDNRIIERTSSVDAEYNSITVKQTISPFSDGLDETSPKKKTNVLRKISGLWKKGPK